MPTRVNTPKRDQNISVRVSSEIKEKLDHLAVEEDRTVSWIVAKMIERSLKGRVAKGKAT